MRRLNVILTLSSLNVLLVTIERFSFTTKVILQPYSFLRLHEVFQITALILITVILPFFVLKEVTDNFDGLKKPNGVFLGLFFIIGIYFYATGNGLHEVSSFLFNTFCNVKQFTGTMCGSMFFNDYYFGNILYFIGAFLMTIPLILFERERPSRQFAKKDMIVIFINSIVFAFAIFAYAAFDRVLVGLVYSVITMVVVDFLLFTAKTKYTFLPYTSYAALAYTLGTIASVIFRLR